MYRGRSERRVRWRRSEVARHMRAARVGRPMTSEASIARRGAPRHSSSAPVTSGAREQSLEDAGRRHIGARHVYSCPATTHVRAKLQDQE